MAITYFRYDDPGAPVTTGNDAREIATLIITLLTTGYTGKPGAGWTIAYDDSANNGNAILEDPDGDCYVIRPYTNDDMEFGMCLSADAAGTMVGYRSGTYNGSSGYRQRMVNCGDYMDRWFALYDDQSATLWVRGIRNNYDDWNAYRNSTGFDSQLSMYLGSLKPPVPGAYAPKVFFAGTPAQYNDAGALFNHNTRSYVAEEGHSGTILKPYADETLSGSEYAFVPSGTSNRSVFSAPNTSTGGQYIGLLSVNCYIARSASNPGLEFIGSIRGYKHFPALFDPGRSAADTFARWIDPDAATYPSMVAYPLDAGDGFKYYTWGDRSSQYGVNSDNPDWW